MVNTLKSGIDTGFRVVYWNHRAGDCITISGSKQKSISTTISPSSSHSIINSQYGWGTTLAKTQKVIPVTIYDTPEQKMILDMIRKKKRSNVSNLLRSVIDAYLKYMDKAFLHPGEQDVMARLQKLEDRLVRLNLRSSPTSRQAKYCSIRLIGRPGSWCRRSLWSLKSADANRTSA